MVWRVLVAVGVVAGLVVAGPATSARAAEAPWVPPSGGVSTLLHRETIEARTGQVFPGGVHDDAENCILAPGSLTPVGLDAVRIEVSASGDGVDCVRKFAQHLLGSGSVSAKCEGGGTTVSILDRLIANMSTVCGGGRVVIDRAQPYQVPGLKVFIASFRLVIYPPGALTVTCVVGSEVQVIHAGGYGTLSVRCPPGGVPVGVSLDGESYQVPGYAANPQLAAACALGECAPVITRGGYSCDPTMALSSTVAWCQQTGSTGNMPEGSTCEWKHPTLGVLTLVSSDCASWLEGVAGTPIPEPDDSDTDIVTEWLQRIKSAVDQVRQAVVSGLGEVSRKLDGIREAIAGIGLPDPGGEGPDLPGEAPADFDGPEVEGGYKDGLAEAIADRFGPWTDAISGLIEAFNAPDPGCEGPSVLIPYPVNKTIQPFSACAEPWATVARVFRAALSVVLIVGGGLACLRLLASAIGYQTGQGGGGEGDA